MTLGFLTDGRVEDVAFAAAEGFDCLELALFGDTQLFDDSSAFKAALAEHKIARSLLFHSLGRTILMTLQGQSAWCA